MSEFHSDLTTLLRRALAAQVDLGMGEIIVGGSNAASMSPSNLVAAIESRQISVTEALGASEEGSHRTEQAAMNMISQPAYDSLDAHRAAICACQLCPLGKTRNEFVYGVGNPHAEVMFIGEGPGAEEDRRGEPFVGRAGQLLDKILAAMQLDRTKVYIANVVKCRPPNNRDPLPEEMNQCMPYLREQIRLIRPKIICALGRIAAQALLNTATPLGKLRGSWHQFESIPLLVTYHPAALLRFPQYKKDTWADMQLIMARLGTSA